MLDYIGGDITGITHTRSGHKITLQLPDSEEGQPITQTFHVRGPVPGQLGDKLVVMVLEDEVAGWHNQATGMQGNLLHALPRLRWRTRDAGITLVAAVVPSLAGHPVLALAAALGWLCSAALWRHHAKRSARGELLEALHLAAGVQPPTNR